GGCLQAGQLCGFSRSQLRACLSSRCHSVQAATLFHTELRPRRWEVPAPFCPRLRGEIRPRLCRGEWRRLISPRECVSAREVARKFRSRRDLRLILQLSLGFSLRHFIYES